MLNSLTRFMRQIVRARRRDREGWSRPAAARLTSIDGPCAPRSWWTGRPRADHRLPVRTCLARERSAHDRAGAPRRAADGALRGFRAVDLAGARAGHVARLRLAAVDGRPGPDRDAAGACLPAADRRIRSDGEGAVLRLRAHDRRVGPCLSYAGPCLTAADVGPRAGVHGAGLALDAVDGAAVSA